MATEMSLLCFPVDRVMRGDFLENLPAADAASMIHEYRDRSLDEAEVCQSSALKCLIILKAEYESANCEMLAW
jgi:hypothetical protein